MKLRVMKDAVTCRYFLKNWQKQPRRGVPRKKCFDNMQQIYRRTTMPKCNFNKVAKITLWYRCSPVNLLHIFRTPCLKNTSGCLFLNWKMVKNSRQNEYVKISVLQKHFKFKLPTTILTNILPNFFQNIWEWLLLQITAVQSQRRIWDKVFKNRPSRICGRQPLKNLMGYALLKQTTLLQIF